MRASRVTVVIPTVGRACLLETVRRLNRGTHIPDEILVCVAKGSEIPALEYANVEIIQTDIEGQVAQRAIGFRKATNDYVLQLDDDIIVGERCIELLLVALKDLGCKAAVSPFFRRSSSPESGEICSRNSVLRGIYVLLMNGSLREKPGSVFRAGINPPHRDPSLEGSMPSSSEWLPGGCMLHHRQNLILDNFYPFDGKAYCEDLIHSYLLRSRGVTLYVCSGAVCYHDYEPPYTLHSAAWFRHLKGDFRARLWFVRLVSGSPTRMLLFYILQNFKYAGLRVKRFFSG